jgi:hypothetical protein
MRSWKSFLLVSVFAVGSSARAQDHAAPVSGSASDSCDDIADKVCRAEESKEFLSRAESLAAKTQAELDALIADKHGPEWKQQLLSRLEAEGFSVSESSEAAELAKFFSQLYSPDDSEGMGPFTNESIAACSTSETSDSDIEAKLVSLWASSGGPTYESFEGTLLSIGGSAVEKRLSPRFRNAVASFKDKPAARKLLQTYDSWGLSKDRSQEAKTYLEHYKSYLQSEHAFIVEQRKSAAETAVQDRERMTRLLRLCAIQKSLQDSGDDCYSRLFDSTPEGVLLVAEKPVVESRLDKLETQVLGLLEDSGKGALEKLRASVDKTLFPGEFPAEPESPEALLSSMLSQQISPKFDFSARVAAEMPPFQDLSVRDRLCSEMQDAAAVRLRTIVNDFHEDLQLSKPFLKKAREAIYTPQMIATQRAQFDVAKSLVSSVVEKKLLPQVASKQKRAQMRSSLASVEPHVPPSVDSLPFVTKAGAAHATLDLDKLDEMPNSTKNFYAMLVQPGLSGVSDVNAYYTPEVTVGVQKDGKNVFMYPGMQEAFKEQPAGLMGVWAHEIGHNFGPTLAQLNGHGMSQEMKKLLECLKKSHALGMHDNQADECIADWLSAESIGLLMDDNSKRKQLGLPATDYEFAKQVLAPFCYFMDQGAGGPRDAEHPLARRRINGIHGAHPRLRTALGCPATSPNYCTLEGSQP